MTTIWDETKMQASKMKGRPFKEKLGYFWEYYKTQTLIIVGSIALLTAIIHAVVTSKDYALSVVAINSIGFELDKYTEEWTNDLTSRLDFDPKKYEVAIDTSISLGTDSITATEEYANVQKFAAMMSSQTIDVLVANTSIYEQYAQNQYYQDLRTVFTEDELKAFDGQIYYTDAATYADYEKEDADPNYSATEVQKEYIVDHRDPSSMESPVPVGIFLDAGTRIGDAGFYSYFIDTDIYQGHKEEGIIGIPINTPRLEAAHDAVLYFCNR